eukprot:GSMAST32.ASY1.ANO1.1628.1 assembled CDS
MFFTIYVLRPTTTDVDGKQSKSQNNLPTKQEVVVWLTLTSHQQALYHAMLEKTQEEQDRRDDIAAENGDIAEGRCILKELCELVQICNHPLLVAEKEFGKKDLSSSKDVHRRDNTNRKYRDFDMYYENDESISSNSDNDIRNIEMNRNVESDVESDIENKRLEDDVKSKNIEFVSALLRNLHTEGHRVLIFSRSCRMLDLIENFVLKTAKYKHYRLDGSIQDASERAQLIEKFNRKKDIFCFLITTQCGGVGINLTGADRVIMLDPGWNPAADEQAVDRVYRIGQTRPVLVYRLVTCTFSHHKFINCFFHRKFRT